MSAHSKETSHFLDFKMNTLVWIDLMIFTFVTIEIAQFDFKELTVVIALLVATVKSILVGYYFMHLKFENKVFRFMVILTLLVFIAVLILLFSDYIVR